MSEKINLNINRLILISSPLLVEGPSQIMQLLTKLFYHCIPSIFDVQITMAGDLPLPLYTFQPSSLIHRDD